MTPPAPIRIVRAPRDKGGRYHHGDLRRALVEAALELVHQAGPAGITLREAARRAGVTHAAPYRHFADKESLLAAVAEEGFIQLRGKMELSTQGVSGLAAIEAIGLAYVHFAQENPSHFRVMFGAELGDKRRHPSLLEADQAVFDVLREAIASAQRALELPAGEPASMGMVAWSMLHGVAAMVVDGQLARAGVRGKKWASTRRGSCARPSPG
ncbi:MAG: TetR/AcrR family transcriptional regulator [Myxococcales bacterium]